MLADEAQETRRVALARQHEAAFNTSSYEQRVELAEDGLIICFHTVAPPDRVVSCHWFLLVKTAG